METVAKNNSKRIAQSCKRWNDMQDTAVRKRSTGVLTILVPVENGVLGPYSVYVSRKEEDRKVDETMTQTLARSNKSWKNLLHMAINKRITGTLTIIRPVESGRLGNHETFVSQENPAPDS